MPRNKKGRGPTQKGTTKVPKKTLEKYATPFPAKAGERVRMKKETAPTTLWGNRIGTVRRVVGPNAGLVQVPGLGTAFCLGFEIEKVRGKG